MKILKKANTRGLLVFTLLLTMLLAVPAAASSKKLGEPTEVKAVGINGGVRVSWRRAKNATGYILYAKDYKGKKHKVVVPDNVTGTFAHEYDKYKTRIGKYHYWDVKKIDHNYHFINTWMNKNKKTYSFRVVAVGKNGKKTKSKWVKARPFNVEKDAPEQDVNLPGINVNADPESASSKLEDTSKFQITKIIEGNKKVKLKWKENVRKFKAKSYEVKYRTIYSSEKENRKSKYKVIVSGTKKTSITISGLKNEQEYEVVVTVTGTISGKTYQLEAKERVIPHSASSRKKKVAQVIVQSPYSSYDNLAWYTKNVAEAYANYGNNGGPFKSGTKYFLWVNLYQLRMYIFRKTVSNEWRLWKDMPCGIGWEKKPSEMGTFLLSTKAWVYQFGSLHVQYLSFFGGYYGNAIHTETYETMESKMLTGKFESAGCIRIDRLWAKWVYEKAEGSTFLIR